MVDPSTSRGLDLRATDSCLWATGLYLKLSTPKPGFIHRLQFVVPVEDLAKPEYPQICLQVSSWGFEI